MPIAAVRLAMTRQGYKDLGTLSACIQFPDRQLDTVAQGPGDVDLECRRSPSLLYRHGPRGDTGLSQLAGLASGKTGIHTTRAAGNLSIRQPIQPTCSEKQ